MKDSDGLYYYPDPSNTEARVYVRRVGAEIEFRLWLAQHEDVWEKHGWIAYSTIKAAAEIYKEQANDPMALYDYAVAEALLLDDERKKNSTQSQRYLQ